MSITCYGVQIRWNFWNNLFCFKVRGKTIVSSDIRNISTHATPPLFCHATLEGQILRKRSCITTSARNFKQLSAHDEKIGKSILEQQAAASNPSVQLSFKYFFIINLDLAFFNNWLFVDNFEFWNISATLLSRMSGFELLTV